MRNARRKITAASTSVPGGRQTSISWTDSTGNFWVFGGFNLSPAGQPNAFNDLWKFDGSQWTWVSGSNSVNQTASYGTQGVSVATNVPGACWSPAAWSDASGNFWLFRGFGYDATGNGTLADLWESKAGQWIWVKGPSSVSQTGVYGIQPNPVVWPHVPNDPGSRWGGDVLVHPRRVLDVRWRGIRRVHGRRRSVAERPVEVPALSLRPSLGRFWTRRPDALPSGLFILVRTLWEGLEGTHLRSAWLFLSCDFRDQPIGLIDFPQRLQNSRRMHRHGARLPVRIEVIQYERFDVAVKYDSDELALPIDHGAAGIASDDVGRAHEIERRR